MLFMRAQDKGFNMDRMLIVSAPRVVDRSVAKDRLITFKNELKQLSGVKAVATSAAIPGGGFNWGTGVRKDGTESEASKNASIAWIDPDFIPTYDIKVLQGRSFDMNIKSDMESVLINEAAVEAFGLGDPEKALTERLIMGDDTAAIVGVLKNYHWNSLKEEHTPFIFKADTISYRAYSILLQGGNMPESVSTIEDLYKEAFPGNPFDYYFLEDFFNRNTRVSSNSAIFSGCLLSWPFLLRALDFGDWRRLQQARSFAK